jgi:hypothetical protein
VIQYKAENGGDRLPLSDAKRKANNKYIKNNMTVMGCKVKKEDVARYHEAAARAGTTVNCVLKSVLDQLLSEHGEEASKCKNLGE